MSGSGRSARKTGRLIALLALFGSAAASLAGAQQNDTPAAPPAPVEALRFGEAMFHYYQDDFLATITALQVAQQQAQLPRRLEEAKLLEAGLYLDYGMQREAQKLFETLLDDQTISAEGRNRIWYALARIAFRGGHDDDAEAALGHIDAPLSDPDLEGRRLLLASQVLISQGRFEEAARRLEPWPANAAPGLRPYALYNRAVALIRAEQVAPALELLGEITQTPPGEPDAEQLALIDRARLSLGNTLLKLDNSAAALAQFEQIRLQGPFAEAALLGAGWAHARQGQFDKAILFWQELSQRDSTSHPVEEAAIALPYAYSRLGALGNAAELYEAALTRLEAQQQQLDTLIDTIRQGSLLEEIARLNPRHPFERGGQLNLLADAEAGRHLYPLLASETFRQALRNYLDLRQISQTLPRWQRTATAFDDILQTRRQGYQELAPLVRQELSEVDLDELSQRYKQLRQHYQAIDETDYSLQLAEPAEKRQWQRLADIEARLARLPDEPRFDKLRRSQRLLKGLLIWQLDSHYKARLWQVKKGLIQVERAMAEARASQQSVEQALVTARQRFSGYAERIDQIQARIDQIEAENRRLLQAQADHIVEMALAALQDQRQALSRYIGRARFALAQIYDQASQHPPATDAPAEVQP